VEAIINLARTSFIVVLLTFAAIYFTSDANSLVLDPIERMLEKVKLIAANPLSAASDDMDQAGIMSVMQNIEDQNQQDKKKSGPPKAQYETLLLEKAITKIGHLLAIGFGEAGSAIIANNMSSGGDLNPMM
jgi:hypothetical protein